MKTRSSAAKWLLMAALLLQTACGNKSVSEAVATPLGLSVHNVTVREPVAGRDVTVAYLTIRNQGDTERLLLGASSDYATRIEIHEHQHSEGRMRMVKLASLPIAANSETVLESGGAHLMLFELQPPYSLEQAADSAIKQQHLSVELTLAFDQGESITVATTLSSVLD